MTNCDEAFRTLYECFGLYPELKTELFEIQQKWEQFKVKCAEVISMGEGDATQIHDDFMILKSVVESSGVCFGDPEREFEELWERFERLSKHFDRGALMCYQALLEKYGFSDVSLPDFWPLIKRRMDDEKRRYERHSEYYSRIFDILKSISRNDVIDVMHGNIDELERALNTVEKLRKINELSVAHLGGVGDSPPFCWHEYLRKAIRDSLGLYPEEIPMLTARYL